MGHKTHSQRRGINKGGSSYGWAPVRYKALWFYPTEAGEKELHISGPVNVESGFRPFLKEKIGAHKLERKLVDRAEKYGIRLAFKDGQEVYLRQGKNGEGSPVLVGMLKDQPNSHREKNAVPWKPHIPGNKASIYRTGLY